MRMRMSLVLFVALSASSVVACGSTTTLPPAPAAVKKDPPVDTTPVTDTADAGPIDAAPVVDHGAPTDTYPAFTPEVGQLVDNKGDILKNPVIVTVTWPDETN